MSRLGERIENFTRAYKLFNDAITEYNNNKQNELIHMALIQTFEIVFELGWKILKDQLSLKGIEVYAPRDAIKEAFAANILPNAQIWIDMLNDRNSSTHEYNQEKVNKIIDSISNIYFEELKTFYDKVKVYHD